MYKINVFFLSSICACIFHLIVINLCKNLYSFIQRVCVCVRVRGNKTKRSETDCNSPFAALVIVIMMVYIKSFK